MKPQLVLSLMPGIDMLGLAFKQEGFCVVQGGDVIFGGDVRTEHYPSGRFDGVISGPPCQAFSPLMRFAEYHGYEPSFGNLIPEFERCVSEVEPEWFLMENVKQAPRPVVDSYSVWSTLLNSREVGAEQDRTRRWSFGLRSTYPCVLAIDVVALHAMTCVPTIIGGSHGRPGAAPRNAKTRNWFEYAKKYQGLHDDFDLPGFTVAGKCKAVGNGVPMAMGRALAKAVRRAIEET